jgi:hypothetical protein
MFGKLVCAEFLARRRTTKGYRPLVPIGAGIPRVRRTSHIKELDHVSGDATSARPKPDVPRMPPGAVVQKRVLCATDLSPRSQSAVGRAALLADCLDTQLLLLHVMEPDQISGRSLHARSRWRTSVDRLSAVLSGDQVRLALH